MFSFKMNEFILLVVLICFVNVTVPQGTGSGKDGNLRLCIVEGRGTYKRAPKYCPILDAEKSGVECVLGTDRLDCLRRISKGKVDFGVFAPEDLIAAQWANIDVLVTNELRTRPRPYARSIVALVNRRILPDSPLPSTLSAVLRNTSLCHPGVGMDDIRPLSDTLSGYLESLVLERSCNASLSHTENRLKALADFYGKACKAGPWVPDKTRDSELKREFPSLCAACGSPRCSATDRYYGDAGSLACVIEGAGDVSWGDADDVKKYIQLNIGNDSFANEHFAYLCRDGSWRHINEEPCVWLNRPWNAIVAKRKASEAVDKIIKLLTSSSVTADQHWRGALTALLESNQALPEPLQPAKTPLDYLARADGFREAYSQSGCDPPRHITLCTTSLLANNKCEWLSEAGAVYGISPPLQCAMRNSSQECLRAVTAGDCDVAVADSDWLVPAVRNYSLTPLLHEITPIVEQTNTIVAYINSDSQITKMADLRGKRAAFPRFDGAAWHSVLRYITEKENITCNEFMHGYFKEICAPGLDGRECFGDGEEQALRSLVKGKSDVAFISMTTYNMFKGKEPDDMKKIVPLCPEDNKKYCFVGWSNIGHVFAAKNLSMIRQHEIINVFTKLDQLFGKHPPFHNPMFSMYGAFNYQMDVIFHNNTRSLATGQVLRTHPYDKIPFNFERNIVNITNIVCVPSFGGKTTPSLLTVLVTLVAFLWIS